MQNHFAVQLVHVTGPSMNARLEYKIIRTYVHTTQTDLGYCWHKEPIRDMSLLASLAAKTYYKLSLQTMYN